MSINDKINHFTAHLHLTLSELFPLTKNIYSCEERIGPRDLWAKLRCGNCPRSILLH